MQPVQGVRWVSRAGLVLKVRLATPDCQAEAELLDPRVSQGNQVHWDHEEQMVYLAVEGDLAHKVQQACLEDLDRSEDLVGCGMHFEF